MRAPGASGGPLGAFAAAAAWWVGVAARRAVAVLAAAAGLTAAAAVYTFDRLAIDTDTPALIAGDLPFKRDARAHNRAFPQAEDSFVVLLTGDSPDRADAAAAALARALRRDARFHTVYAPEIDPFFVRNGLLYLDADDLAELADRLADAQPLLARLAREPGLAALFDVLGRALAEAADGGDAPAGLADVVARIADVAASVADGTPRPLSWSDLIRGKASDADDRRRFIVVQPEIDYRSLRPARRAMELVRAHARALGLDPGRGVTVRLTGSAAIATEELESVARGARLAGAVSLLLVGALLVVGLGSLRLVAAVLLTLVAGLVWTAGLTTLAIGHLNLISVAFAVLFIGLGVDFGIHFGLRYKEEAARGLGPLEALPGAAAGVAGALGLAALAAAAGFYAAVPTDFAGLSELGLIAGSGMFVALFANLTLLPALLALLPVRAAPAAPAGPVRAAAAALVRRRRPIAAAALALGVGAAALAPAARFDVDPIALKDPATESVRAFLELTRDSRAPPYTISAMLPDLDSAARAARRLDRLAEVDRTVTLAKLAPDDQAGKLDVIDGMAVFLAPILHRREGATGARAQDGRGRHDSAGAIPALRQRLALAAGMRTAPALRQAARRLDAELARIGDDEAARALLERSLLRFLPDRLERLRLALAAAPVTVDDLPADLRARYLAADGSARIQVFPSENLADAAALRRFVDAVRRVVPTATEAPVEIVESGKVVAAAVRQAALTALVAVTAMLLLLLRSLRETLLVLAAVLLAGLLTVAASVALDIPFNFANVIVLPLLMGLGVAGGIHIVLRARRDASLSETSTPRAVVLSALTTIGSFGSLSLSSHRGTASMGELLMLAIAFTLLATMVVLPALMALRAPRRDPAA